VSKSLVAHLSAAGSATTSVFYNNTTKNDQKAQLTLRHLVAAGAVDVYLNGTLAFARLANPDQATAFLVPGTVTVRVTAAGNPSAVVLPNTRLDLKARTNTIVYGVGVASSFSVIEQVLPMS
jgi:hypothetical protein